MNSKQQFINDLTRVVKELFAVAIADESVEVTNSREETYGDFATNIAFVLAKQVQQAPQIVATQIAAKLSNLGYQVNPVNGFINWFEAADSVSAQLNAATSEFGQLTLGQQQKVMVEFGQPNTHKAFHVGHLKSAISGLAIVGLLENYGYEVIKANFYGDIGMHVAKCTWGAKQLGLPDDVAEMDVHERMKLIDKCYSYGAQQFAENPQAEAEIRQVNTEIYQHADTVDFKLYWQLREWSHEHLNAAFAKLGVVYDRQYPESEVFEHARQIVEDHKSDIFTLSEGAWVFDGKPEGLTTWVFLTSEGHPTYEAKDLALGYAKFRDYPGLVKSIYTTSVEQKEHFKIVFHVLKKIAPEVGDKSVHIPFGWLLRNNKKTSSRMGDSVKGMDIIAEAEQAALELISTEKDYAETERQAIAEKVGLAGLKFLILSHEFHKDINYDPQDFISLDGFSGPYLLYALARARSIQAQGGVDVASWTVTELATDFDLALGKKILRFPEVTKMAAENYAPHLVCNYLFDLAKTFNQFYTNCPVLNAETEQLKLSRLKLTQLTSLVLQRGLHILGIAELTRM